MYRTSNVARCWQRIVLAGVGVIAAAAVLTGCASVQELVLKTSQKHFDTYADAPSSKDSEDLAWFMPNWVPEDARDIDVRLHTKDPGYVIAFDSEQSVDLGSCEPTGPHGGPALDADFLPKHLPTTGLVTCGDGRVTVQIDGRWYGWTPTKPIIEPAPYGDPLETPSLGS